MSVFINPLKSDKAKFREEISLRIETHKKVAMHLEAAAKSHTEAAKYHEEGNHEFAALNTFSAHNHTQLAIEGQNKLAKSRL